MAAWARTVRGRAGLLRVVRAKSTVREQPVSVSQLQYDAELAELSSLVYNTSSNTALADRLPAAGLRLVAEGSAPFTRWFVAEDAQGVRTLCARGVSWMQPGLDVLGLARALVSIWPTDARGAGGRVAVHAGVADLARELHAKTAPWIERAADEGAPLRLVGHSLGGSLVQALLADRRRGWQGRPVELVTFGSPPVLKCSSDGHRHQGMGTRNLQELLGPDLSARHYVLGQDPVPGLLLSAKPLFKALTGGGGLLRGPIAALLKDVPKRGLEAAGIPRPGIPAYQAAGPVFLVRWTQAHGHAVVRLTAEEVARELAVDVEKLASKPLELMRAITDHQHSSYAQELLAAATNAAKSVDQQP